MPALSPDQVNSLLVKKLIQDLVIECTSNTQVVVKSGSRAGADDGAVIMQLASDLTLDITVAGKNGLDTGSEASDTWYYLWMIYNPATEEVAGVLSVSATAPTLPSGFTKKRLVGAVRNDGSSNFRTFIQRGTRVQYLTGASVLSAGSATAFTAISLTSAIPSGTDSILYEVRVNDTTTATPNAILSLDGTSNSVAVNASLTGSGATSFLNTGLMELVNNLTDQIWYRVTQVQDDCDIWVDGFTLNL